MSRVRAAIASSGIVPGTKTPLAPAARYRRARRHRLGVALGQSVAAAHPERIRAGIEVEPGRGRRDRGDLRRGELGIHEPPVGPRVLDVHAHHAEAGESRGERADLLGIVGEAGLEVDRHGDRPR